MVKSDKGLVGDRGETNIYVVASSIEFLSVIEENKHLHSVKSDKGLVGDRGETNIYIVSSPIKVLSVIEERQTST